MFIGSSIRYENTLFGNYFLKCYIVKIIFISFNCFSEYRLNHYFHVQYEYDTVTFELILASFSGFIYV